MIDAINQILGAWRATLKATLRLSVWHSFLVLFLFQVLITLLIAGAFHPLLAGWMLPLIRSLFGGAFLHYPNLYVAFPAIIGDISKWVDGTLGVLAVGVGTVLFARFFSDGHFGRDRAWRISLRRYTYLFLFWIVAFGLNWVLNEYLVSDLFRSQLGNPRRQLLIWGGASLVHFVFWSLVTYGPVCLVVLHDTFGQSLSHAVRGFLRRPLTTFFLVFIPYIPNLIAGYVTTYYSPQIVKDFNPESIVWLVLLAVLLGCIGTALHCGSVTYFYLVNVRKD